MMSLKHSAVCTKETITGERNREEVAEIKI